MNKEFIDNFMSHQEFPEEAIKEFDRLIDLINNDLYYSAYFDGVVDAFYADKNQHSEIFIAISDKLAEKMKENTYTLQMLFLLAALPRLFEKYKEQEIDEQIFWDSTLDLRAKLVECYKCKSVWGTFVTGWFGRFYELDRSAFGRFQIEQNTHVGAAYENGDIIVTPGDKAYGFHIPSHPVSLTDEVRFDSYRRAYEFYKARDNFEGPIIFTCSSWLLFPPYAKALGEQSNVSKFQKDFDLICVKEKDKFYDAWRVYYANGDLPVEDWQEDTSMQRKLKKHFLDGGMAGDAYGFIVFDGEKIIN